MVKLHVVKGGGGRPENILTKSIQLFNVKRKREERSMWGENAKMKRRLEKG